MKKLLTRLTIDAGFTKDLNLAERLSAEDLTTIGAWVVDGYKRDDESRSEWFTKMQAAMNLAMLIQNTKNFPWPNSSNVIFPLVAIAALQFSSRSYGNLVKGNDVVKYRVFGDDDEGKLQKRADNIGRHMSWQVLEQDDGWEEQHDRLLINLAIVGTAFIKTWYNNDHNVSELIVAKDFVIDYWAKSVNDCARKSQVFNLYHNEVWERANDGRFCEDLLDKPWFTDEAAPPESESNIESDKRAGLTAPTQDRDAPITFIEQHRSLDLDGDGYEEPYIVTVHKDSGEVVRIVARWERDEDIKRGKRNTIVSIKSMEYFTKFSFIPSPDGAMYDVGFGTLIGPINDSVNTAINQMFDAGTMYNSNGGFLGRGAKIRGGGYSFAPWEWKRVDSTGDDIRKNIVPLPTKEPSVVMFNLLNLLIQYTDRLAGTVDQMVGVTPGQNTPAETSRNTMEQGMQVYSQIFKRVWRSMKEEFKKLHTLNALYLPAKSHFGESGIIAKEEYRGSSAFAVPVADPNLVTDGQRLMRAQAMREAAHSVPGYNIPEVEKNFLRELRVDNVERFYPGSDKVPALPNPKMQVEQLKQQSIKMKLDYDKWKVVQQLQADQKETMARITLMQAQTIEIISQIEVAHQAAALKAFETAIDTLKNHSEMINERIKTMMEVASGTDQEGDGGVEGTPNKPALLPGPAQMAGGPGGAVGNEGVPAG